MKIRVEWVGGPLDGAVECLEGIPHPWWEGPDLSDLHSRVIVYVLAVEGANPKERRYIYDQSLTDAVNARRRPPS